MAFRQPIKIKEAEGNTQHIAVIMLLCQLLSSRCFLFVILFPVLVGAEQDFHYDTDVLILGAGISGIAAAQTLHKAGIEDFIILEGADRIGGRVKEVKFHGTTIELGANWIQGIKHNPLATLAKKYGLQGKIEVGSYIVRDGNTGANATAKGHLDKFNQARAVMEKMRDERRKKKEEDISWRVGLRLAGWYPSTPEEVVTEYGQADFEYGVPPKYISSRTHMRTHCSIHSPLGKQMFVTDQRGFIFLIEKIAEEFLRKNDSRLKLNSRVKSIMYDDKKVTVLTNNGHNITAKRALITFSIGVLKSGQIKFISDLPPWKIQVIFQLNMILYTKIFLKFPYTFWDDEEYIYLAFKHRGYYPAWQNLCDRVKRHYFGQ
ncbi:polyamine oxidase 7-like [Actinia tenebrosa]|uniref:Polyamine oxidase 7-like n=1 Tax=Actinia tenebrosa TaxID=6105 RepID=A0A6P8HF81_ACTTE|nr:polyamine oxidase 7-like [Actinia tenebrosa]